MDKELVKELNATGRDLLEWAKSGSSFINEQAPLVIQEMIKFEIYTSVLWLIIWGSIILFNCFCGYKMATGKWDSAPAGAVVGLFISGLILFGVQVHDLIHVLVAPRVFIIKELSTLIGE